VEGLLRILAEVIDKELPELNNQGVQLRHLGRLEDLPENIPATIEMDEESLLPNQQLFGFSKEDIKVL